MPKVDPASVLPANHKLGMKVVPGGSMCANCRYLVTPKTCGNKGFQKWNGSAKLPEAAFKYCCDLWQGWNDVKKDDF